MAELCKDFQNAVYNLVVENLSNLEKWEDKNIQNNLTLGFLDGDKIIGGVIFSLTGRICYLTIWAESPKWCSRSNLANIFEIAFDFGVVAIKCAIDYHNYKSNKLVHGLGFKREGILRFARDNGHDEIIWGITKPEMKRQDWWRSIRKGK